MPQMAMKESATRPLARCDVWPVGADASDGDEGRDSVS